MATTRLMPLHIGEGRSFSTSIEDIIDYVENPEIGRATSELQSPQ